MQEQLTKLLKETKVPGLSAAVVTNDVKTFYLGKMGKVSPYDHREVKAGLIYDLASLTKVIGTTTRLLQLVQSNQLTLDQTVNELLPQFPNLKMTLRELLLHQSGLIADFSDKTAFSEEYLLNYLHHFNYQGPQRTRYSDIGFLLLGFIIETIDNSNLQESFTTHIFSPLQMKETTYFPQEIDRVVPTEQTASRGLIVGKVHDSKAFHMKRPVGSAGLFSTLDDLVHFVQGIQTTKLLSKPTLQLLLKTSDGRTLGWEKPFGEQILFHTGFTGTSIGIDLKKQKSLILLTNRIHPNRNNTAFIKQRFQLYQEFFQA